MAMPTPMGSLLHYRSGVAPRAGGTSRKLQSVQQPQSSVARDASSSTTITPSSLLYSGGGSTPSMSMPSRRRRGSASRPHSDPRNNNSTKKRLSLTRRGDHHRHNNSLSKSPPTNDLFFGAAPGERAVASSIRAGNYLDLRANVLGSMTSGEGFDRHVEYLIEYAPSFKFRVYQRYSAFKALHKSLQREFPRIALPNFPQSHWTLKLRRRNTDAAHVEEKRLALDAYIASLLDIEEVRKSPLIAKFFFGAGDAVPLACSSKTDPPAVPIQRRFRSMSDSGELRNDKAESEKETPGATRSYDTLRKMRSFECELESEEATSHHASW